MIEMVVLIVVWFLVWVGGGRLLFEIHPTLDVAECAGLMFFWPVTLPYMVAWYDCGRAFPPTALTMCWSGWE